MCRINANERDRFVESGVDSDDSIAIHIVSRVQNGLRIRKDRAVKIDMIASHVETVYTDIA